MSDLRGRIIEIIFRDRCDYKPNTDDAARMADAILADIRKTHLLSPIAEEPIPSNEGHEAYLKWRYGEGNDTFKNIEDSNTQEVQ